MNGPPGRLHRSCCRLGGGTRGDSKTEPEKSLGASENTVYIGRKNVMNYVLAVVTQFNQGHEQVNVKARGQSISRAVDVTQIAKSRFFPEMRVENVELGTESFTDESGRPSKVSTIHITVAKQ